MKAAAVDFETYYDAEVGIESLGVWHYCRHEAFDAYLVTIATSDGHKYCGRPEDFDWSCISGDEWRWISHNRSFDQPVYESLVECGKLPPVFPSVWECTADMCAYFGAPRSLKNASAELLGADVSKDTRNKMKGKRWEDMDAEFRREVEEYAIKDAELCLALWEKLGDQWPEHERWLSRETTRMCVQGVPVNRATIEDRLEHLKVLLWEARAKLPWVEEDRPVLSPLALAEECHKVGITPPPSLAEDSTECEAWELQHGEKYPWVAAMRQFRKCNGLMRKLETMRKRTRPDGWMSYGLKYFGATTGRDSGDSGLNMQNLQRSESYGVNIRGLIEAPEGMTLVIADLSQIEPRCLSWLAQDEDMLAFIKASPDLYEAQARAWGFWDKPEPLKTDTTGIRHLVKQLNLGLGYGMGVSRFSDVTGLPVGEASRLVKLYREKNPKVGLLWKKLENSLRQSVRRSDKFFEVELPSGRVLRYRNPNDNEGNLSAEVVRGGKYMRLKWWGGSLVENCTQAMARDVFMENVSKIREAGLNIVMRVHDEVVCCVFENEAEAAKKFIEEIMSVPPAWAPNLPLSAEAKISRRYEK
jgi:DNA polymerase I-like protein with 3'-5' exonuclease and polymerase domains